MSNPVASILERAANNTASMPANVAEKFFDSLGLMQGEYSPIGRAAVGAALGSAVIWAVRPSFAFDKSGNPLPWGKDGTSVPWFTIPAALAIFCGVFI